MEETDLVPPTQGQSLPPDIASFQILALAPDPLRVFSTSKLRNPIILLLSSVQKL